MTVLLLAACGADLAQLETEERALAEEVAVLRANVEEMRSRMQEMGLVAGGPKVTVDVEPENDLAGQIPLEVTRTGEPTPFPPLPAPERRDTTECGFRIGASWLEPLSDQALEQAGSGKASPLLLFQDGRAVQPHAGPAAYEKACKFGFRHAPKYLFLSPDGFPEAVGGTWTLGLSPEVPLARGGDGRPMYWVYPGTTLTFEVGAGWDADTWGEMQVTLDARLMYIGAPEAPAPKPGSPATVSFLGFEHAGKEKVFGVEHRPEAVPDGPWTIDLASPVDGPFVLVEILVVGNADYGLVVTSPSQERDEEGK